MSDSVVIAPTARSFQRNNRPFFYLADTVWSAFTEAEEEEWREYLRYRSQQGFTVLQVTLLRLWRA